MEVKKSLSTEARMLLEKLEKMNEDHINLYKECTVADEGKIFGVDLIVEGVLQRSLSLIDGYIIMVKTGNSLCANALLRLQIDSILRLYACWLVDDPHGLVLPLLEGTPFNRIKSRTGEPLCDAYLREEASKLYPWINNVYKETSGFIHFSKPAMFSTVAGIDEAEHAIISSIGKGGRDWKPEEIKESILAFTEATKSLLRLVYSWKFKKSEVGKQRGAKFPE